MTLDDLTLLSDTTRVRILRLVAQEELGVGELVEILQLPQSTVSRHLKALSTSGWVHKRAVGTSSLATLDIQRLSAPRASLWELVRTETAEDPSTAQDLQRMASILSQRQLDSKAFFGSVGSRWGEVRRDLFGEHFLIPTMMALVDPQLCVGDLGCGSGESAALLATSVSRVIAVDHEARMLELASERLRTFDNVDVRHGDLTKLPIADGELDCALVMLVMHHVEDLNAALLEIKRVLRDGGRLIVVDMTRHERESYRFRMGHVHLGFERDALASMAESAGLKPSRYHLIPADPSAQGPGLFIATFDA